MKKFLMIIIGGLMSIVSINAQVMRTSELEKYSTERYSSDFVSASYNLSQNVTFDKNDSFMITEVINVPGKTKEELYVLLNYWYSNSFNDGKSVIQLNDKDAGVIIGKGYVSEIATHVGGMNRYIVNMYPIIKTDIKDDKIRVTYTIQYYDVERGMGGIGLMGDALSGKPVDNRMREEKWFINACYPFVEKDKHKKTSAKAFVMMYAYSNVMVDKIREAVTNGVNGNESEDW